MAKRHVVYRSSQTGRWVSKEYALAHPDVTEAETVGPLKVLIAKLLRKDAGYYPIDDAGYGLIEVCLAALVIIILVLVVVRLAAPR
jgi:hypothetical protein